MPKVRIGSLDDVLFTPARDKQQLVVRTHFDDHPKLVDAIGIFLASRRRIDVPRPRTRRGTVLELPVNHRISDGKARHATLV